ncbi:MAG: S41 family peptidase [Thermoflexibacter sp.]|jgi:carboxyl-terminal processing protease|nr:S41 family peptidase [Thermoflexibacter sp.]
MSENNFYVRLPIILAIAICAGIFVGAKMFGDKKSYQGDVNANVSKLREVLTHINNEYVDSTNINVLTDHAIQEMLQKLDPHTSYTTAKDMEFFGTQLEGDFEGIGVSFQIFRDTLYVESVLAGGPSEKAGIHSGDKIVKVNEENIAGIGISSRGVFERLRGKKGSKVKITVVRKGEIKPLAFDVVRAKIPQHTVEVAYMIDNKTGFIKLSRFGANVYDEFKEAMEKLLKQGMKQVMIDLRDNPGGYMDRAVNIVDEIVGGDKLIVYTDGKLDKYDEKYRTKNKGIFEQDAVVVLIDEESASASEIVAGALQDNDRAIIVGRRSFGKGLVQKPISLSDGSELRITISRYYTPSGRSIQKPYEMGHRDEYYEAEEKRYTNGDLFHADSNKINHSQEYKTLKGRIVYGGGGIMPDYFVAIDTTHFSEFLTMQTIGTVHEVIREFALDYANDNRTKLLGMGIRNYVRDFQVNEEMLKKVIKMCERQSVKYNERGFEKSKKYIKNHIKAFIGRTVWDAEAAYSVWNQEDAIVQKALLLFTEANKLAEGKLASGK